MARDPPSRDRTYWELSLPHAKATKQWLCSQLLPIGYNAKSSLSRPELVALYKHHHAGHLCYDKCTNDELRKFAKDRDLLPRTNDHLCSRDGMVKLLMSGDMHPTFHRFCDLPAELREQIYHLYVAGITEKPLQHPVDPPLTRVNNLLRTECLAIFYKACTFRIIIGGTWNRQRSLSVDSEHFIRTLSKTKISNIRRLEIVVRVPEDFLTGLDPDSYARALLQFSADMEDYTLDLALWRDGAAYYERRFPAARRKIAAVFDDVVGREGCCKLKARDLLRLGSKEYRLVQAVAIPEAAACTLQ